MRNTPLDIMAVIGLSGHDTLQQVGKQGRVDTNPMGVGTPHARWSNCPIPPPFFTMKPPRCRLCESAHWSNEPHVFATNKETATNSATNRVQTDERMASGSGGGGVAARVRDSDEHANRPKRSEAAAGVAKESVVVGADKTANRRSREATPGLLTSDLNGSARWSLDMCMY